MISEVAIARESLLRRGGSRGNNRHNGERYALAHDFIVGVFTRKGSCLICCAGDTIVMRNISLLRYTTLEEIIEIENLGGFKESNERNFENISSQRTAEVSNSEKGTEKGSPSNPGLLSRPFLAIL